MKMLLRTVLCLGLGLATGGTAFADDAADARAIIDKSIAALGGKEKLTKFKAQTWTEKGTYYGAGAGLPYTGKYALQFPSRFRMEIEGVFTIVVDGDKGWLKEGNNTKEMTKDQLKTHTDNLYSGWVATLLPLQDKAFTLTLLPEIKVEDRPAVGVRVAHKAHTDVDLYFDKATGLLVQSDQRVQSEEEKKEMKQVTFYSDYRDVDGIKIPKKINMNRDGKKYIESENQDSKVLEKLEDAVFAKP